MFDIHRYSIRIILTKRNRATTYLENRTIACLHHDAIFVVADSVHSAVQLQLV